MTRATATETSHVACGMESPICMVTTTLPWHMRLLQYILRYYSTNKLERYNTIRCDTIQWDKIRYDTTRYIYKYNIIQYNTNYNLFCSIDKLWRFIGDGMGNVAKQQLRIWNLIPINSYNRNISKHLQHQQEIVHPQSHTIIFCNSEYAFVASHVTSIDAYSCSCSKQNKHINNNL